MQVETLETILQLLPAPQLQVSGGEELQQLGGLAVPQAEDGLRKKLKCSNAAC